MLYNPPYKITPNILHLVEQIGEALGRYSILAGDQDLKLRRIKRIQTLQGSLAIEGNTLSEEQISTILDGKTIIAPPREIQEVKNAIKAYDQYQKWNPSSQVDLLFAHKLLTEALLDRPGYYRSSNVGVAGPTEVIHIAPPADKVPQLMNNLLNWLDSTNEHPLISSCVFHYEFEFIHPFDDGNGRVGRLWQTLILTKWNQLFASIPIESMIYLHQSEYYDAIAQSSKDGQSTVFIEFMLKIILMEIKKSSSTSDPVSAPVSAPVNLLLKLLFKHKDQQFSPSLLMKKLGLSHRPTFRKNYLYPALELNLIEMTIPEKPSSRNQKYQLTNKGKAYISSNAK